MWSTYLKLPAFLRISGKEVENILLSLGLKKGAKVLDIGCGYGRISTFLKNQGYNVVAIDIEEKMVEEVRRKGIKTYKMSAENLKFRKNSFDLVLTDGLLEHFKNPEKILKEEARVTKKFVVNFIPKTAWWNKILEIVQGTPKVYWRSKEWWIKRHGKFIKNVQCKELKRIWAFICEE